MPRKPKLPHEALPRIRCDFNSVGWSGDEDDDCYYSFDDKALAAHKPRSGMVVFVFEDGQSGLIMGCQATVETYSHPVTGQPKFRLRPVHETGFLG
jgi:hypothetical protein